MKFLHPSRRRQRGTVAILVGLCIVALIGLLGIVIDLGHLYVRKTELQNAADAAALAAAKDLNGKADGIDTAVATAIAVAATNASDFAQTPVSIADAQVRFSDCPDLDPAKCTWVDSATAKADAAKYAFVKVDTNGIAQETRPTWVMQAVNSALADTTANGRAVAGCPLCDGLPIFICPPVGGFKPGQAYFFADNPGAPIGPGNIGYFDPVPPGAPSLIPPGASEMSDIVCYGKTYCIGAGTYSSRTQSAFGKMEKAFNTRFGEYPGEFKDLAPQCRPDSNVKEYRCSTAGTCAMIDWMSTTPDHQSEQDAPGALGVHWSVVRPETTGAEVAGVTAVGYPADGTPYSQTSGSYFTPPMGYEAEQQAGRRIITMAIGDAAACDGSVNGAGKPVPITGFGRFLLPVKAKGTGNPKGIYVEYIETVPRLQSSAPDCKLYR